MFTQIQKNEEIDSLISKQHLVVFYKHSTRCNVSYSALSNIKDYVECYDQRIYLIDVIENRSVSNYLEEISNIRHESPQIIIFKNGLPKANTSHFGITENFLREYLLAV